MVKFNLNYLEYEVKIVNQLKFVSTLLISTSSFILFWDKHSSVSEDSILKRSNLKLNMLSLCIGYIMISLCFIINIWIIFSLSLLGDIMYILIDEIKMKSNKTALDFEKDINQIYEDKNLLNSSKYKEFFKIHKETILKLKLIKSGFRISIVLLLIGSFCILSGKLLLFKNKIVYFSTFIFIIIALIYIFRIYINHNQEINLLKLNTPSLSIDS